MARQYGARSISAEEAKAYVEARKREEDMRRLKIEKYISIAAVAVGVIVLGTGIFAKVTAPGKIADLDAEIRAQEETLTEKQQFIEQGGNIKYVDPVMNSAKEIGTRVAQLQNLLIDFDTTHYINLRSMEAGARLDFTDDHKACLQEFQNCVYLSSSDAAMAGSRANAGIWSYYGQWEFHDTFDYTSDELTVVWICYGDDDVEKQRPLVIVTAAYSAHLNQIKNIQRYTTPAYLEMVNADSLRSTSSGQSGSTTYTAPAGSASSTVNRDQHGDPGIGAPNGLTEEEARRWEQDQINARQQGNAGSAPTGGTGTSEGQWTSPSGNMDSSSVEGQSDGSDDAQVPEESVVLNMGQ